MAQKPAEDIERAVAGIGGFNRQIEVERKKNIETAKSEYEAQLEQQKSLENQLKAVEAKMLVDGQALVRLQELQRDAEANKNICEQFLSRYKATNEQRLLQTSQTKVASLAIPPLRPTRPPLPLLLAALAIASILISTAVVPMLDSKGIPEKSAPKIGRAASPLLQPESPPDLPVWARIPDLPPREFTRSVWQKPITAAAELDLSPHLRALIEKIVALPGPRGKVALVMSVENNAGSSTVARSLNRSAANNGMLSVLIEKRISSPISMSRHEGDRFRRIDSDATVPTVRIYDIPRATPASSSTVSETNNMRERRANPIGRAATECVARVTVGGLRLAVLDLEQTA
jgi:hypothetical protein